MTRGIRSRPHETNSISLKDRYTIKNVIMRPAKMCPFILSGLLSSVSNKISAMKSATVTHTG
jgi:hypothetical protein